MDVWRRLRSQLGEKSIALKKESNAIALLPID